MGKCKHETTVNIPHEGKIKIMCMNPDCKKVIGKIPMPRKKK
jgi:hypothetical protein